MKWPPFVCFIASILFGYQYLWRDIRLCNVWRKILLCNNMWCKIWLINSIYICIGIWLKFICGFGYRPIVLRKLTENLLLYSDPLHPKKWKKIIYMLKKSLVYAAANVHRLNSCVRCHSNLIKLIQFFINYVTLYASQLILISIQNKNTIYVLCVFFTCSFSI